MSLDPSQELLPCPYCGELPQIVIKRNPYYTPPGPMSFSFDAAEGESIACVNNMCPMQPSTVREGTPSLVKRVLSIINRGRE